jgi:hypothetical protein
MDNFGKIKYTYNTLLAEGIAKNSSKEKVAFKKYIKTIKENKPLKVQFDIYYNIENKIESDGWKALSYLDECISLVNNFSKNEIKKANLLISESDLIKNANVEINGDKLKLYEAINTLILTEKSSSTINKIVESKNIVVDYILNNKKEDKVDVGYGLPNSVLSEIAVDKFNEEYVDLSESEKEVISVMFDGGSDSKELLYKQNIKECLELINNLLPESSTNIKEKLLSTKETLLEKKYNEETFLIDVSKVLELKKTLKNN